ncbi:MAG: hypothetical protein J0I84_02330, partial [Terrimonas sp.]|nr:hypothetical protein [Terrimonas sp.]
LIMNDDLLKQLVQGKDRKLKMLTRDNELEEVTGFTGFKRMDLRESATANSASGNANVYFIAEVPKKLCL